MTFVQATKQESGQGNHALHQQLTATVQHALTQAATPGASVALWLDGQPLFVAAIGFRDLAQQSALTVQDRFYIYSVTKSLIAAVILQLVEQGQVALDTPVQHYLPHLPLDTPVTLRQLLNHTGGIPDYGALPAYFAALKADPTRAWTADEFLAATLPTGVTFAPGQGWNYSNIGFLILRQVIERVLQTSLRNALHNQIFTPLALQQIHVVETLEDAQQVSPGYSAYFATDNTLQDVRTRYHPGWVSHGVVSATAADLARVMDAILTGPLLSSASRTALLEGVRVPMQHPLFQQPAYGLGIMIDQASRYGTLAGHGGGGPGYSAAALHLPAVHGHTLTSVVLANRDRDELGLQLALTLATLVADTLARPLGGRVG